MNHTTETNSNANKPRRIMSTLTLNDSFEAIDIEDEPKQEALATTIDAVADVGTVAPEQRRVDSDDDDDNDNDETNAETGTASVNQAVSDVDPDVIPLVFVRESVPLCVLHQRIASSAKLCARFAEIRCSDAVCQAATYIAKSEINEIGAKLPPLIRCRYHGHGCPVEQLLNHRSSHESRCAYRPILGDDNDDDDDDKRMMDEFAVINNRAKPVLVAPHRERMFPLPEPEPEAEKDIWGRLNDSDVSIEWTRASKELGDKAGEKLLRARNVIAEVTAPVLAQIGEATAPVLAQIGEATAPMRSKISNTAAPLVENAAMAAGVVTDKVVNVMVPAIVSSTEKVVNKVGPVLNRGLNDIRDELESSLFAEHQGGENAVVAASETTTTTAQTAPN
jgi:hypothetical protein